MTTTLSVPERVANGVAWLDAMVPDWRDRVVINDLNMVSSCKCVLGQVFAEEADVVEDDDELDALFEDAIFRTGFDIGLLRASPSISVSARWAVECGFDAETEDPGSSFTELQEEWERVLRS